MRSFLTDMCYIDLISQTTLEYWIHYFIKNHSCADKTKLCFGWCGNLVNKEKQKELFMSTIDPLETRQIIRCFQVTYCAKII